VFVLLAGAGLVMFGALVVVPLSGRQTKDEREPPPMNAPWWMKLLAILVPLALGAALVAAAVLGSRPDPVLRRGALQRPRDFGAGALARLSALRSLRGRLWASEGHA
jgi:hypothetical protein